MTEHRQRALLYASGALATLALLVITVFAASASLDSKIAAWRASFDRRFTLLRSALGMHEAVMRATVANEGRMWPFRQGENADLVRRFAQTKGRMKFRTADFPIVVALGDVNLQHPAPVYGPLLLSAQEMSAHSADNAPMMVARSRFFYSIDHPFIAVSSASGVDDLADIACGHVEELIQSLVHDHGAAGSAAKDDVRDGAGPVWRAPSIDPLTRKLSLTLVQGAKHGDHVFAVFAATYPLELMAQYLATERPGDEAAIIVDQQGGLLLQAGGQQPSGLTDSMLGAYRPASEAGAPDVGFRDGLFIVRGKITASGWDLVVASPWHAVLFPLEPLFAMYLLLAFLLLAGIWARVVWLDRKVYRPELAAARMLHESEGLHRALLATSPMGHCLICLESGRVLLSNALMKTYAEQASPDAPALPDRILELYGRAPCGSSRQSSHDLSLSLKDGGIRELLVSMVESAYKGGNVLVCTLADITARKHIEYRLEEARAAAESASKAKSAFLATMSHEIRTPLNAIQGNLELLARERLTRKQNQRLSVVESSSSELLAIINDVLDFSKIESGQMAMESVVFDLGETLRKVVTAFKPAAQAKRLKLDLVIGDPVLPLRFGDPAHIRQILVNLVGNAIKFTDRGHVRIDVTLRDEADPESAVVMAVSDSGVGMTPDQLERLFEPFVQADPSIARLYGGTGLGLALCRRLATLMDGAVSVRSIPRQGSTFTLTLPLKLWTGSRPALAAAPAEADPCSPADKRVLAVDDHPVNLELIRLQLEALGYAVDVADSGSAALNQLSAGVYDLVITDLHMPAIDGCSLAQHARMLYPAMPIMAYTADITSRESSACAAAGIDAILVKPVLLGRLGQEIRRLIGGEARRAPALMFMDEFSSGDPLPDRVFDAMLAHLERSLAAIRGRLFGYDRTAPDTDELLAEELHAVRGAFAMIHEHGLAEACQGMQRLAPMDKDALADALAQFERDARAALGKRAPRGRLIADPPG